jgi:hypothetical protein
MVVPARFWSEMSPDEFAAIVHNGGYLDADQCARLWRMMNYQGEAPKRLVAMVSRASFERFLATQPRSARRQRGRRGG